MTLPNVLQAQDCSSAMGKHKGTKGGRKNRSKKWEEQACCSAVDQVSLDEGSLKLP